MATQMKPQPMSSSDCSSSEKILITLDKIKDIHIAYQEKQQLKELKKKNSAQRKERWGNMFLIFTMLAFGALAYHTHTTKINDTTVLLNEMVQKASQTNYAQSPTFDPLFPTSTLTKQK